MRALLAAGLLSVPLACSNGYPAGAHGRSPAEGGAGGSGGADGSGGTGGEACADPVRCWLEGDADWVPVPDLDRDLAPCALDHASSEGIPETALRWEPCGEGCARAHPGFGGLSGEVSSARTLGWIDHGGTPVAVARVSSGVVLGADALRVDRLVRLPGGATLAAMRGKRRAEAVDVSCGADLYARPHPRLLSLQATMTAGADTAGYRAAVWLPDTGWEFGSPWHAREAYHDRFAVLGPASPVEVAHRNGRVSARLDFATDAWTVLDDGEGFRAGTGDGERAFWIRAGLAGAMLSSWRPDEGIRTDPMPPGLPCRVAAGGDALVAVIADADCREGPVTARLWWGSRTDPDAGGELGEPLLGGMPIGVSLLWADSEHAVVAGALPGPPDPVLLVVRRADGLTRVLRGLGVLLDVLVDGASLYVAVDEDLDGPTGTLYRYDLARLHLLGEAP